MPEEAAISDIANPAAPAAEFDCLRASAGITIPLVQPIPFNIPRHSAISAPVGLASNRLPIAERNVGRPFDVVFRIGRAIEYCPAWVAVPLPAVAA